MSNAIYCWRSSKERYRFLNRQGKILSLTEIYTPVGAVKDDFPYFVALVKFDNGERALGQIVSENFFPKIGNKVIGVLRRLQKPQKKDVVEYGVKFKVIGN